MPADPVPTTPASQDQAAVQHATLALRAGLEANDGRGRWTPGILLGKLYRQIHDLEEQVEVLRAENRSLGRSYATALSARRCHREDLLEVRQVLESLMNWLNRELIEVPVAAIRADDGYTPTPAAVATNEALCSGEQPS